MSTTTKPSSRRQQQLVTVAIFVVSVLLVLAVFSAWVNSLMEGKKKSWAHLGCRSVAVAVEAYVLDKANTTHEFPRTLDDLVQPPFGGSPFLQNGNWDLLDPWGRRYEMERAKKPTGDEYIIVKTTAPDKTPISQFGVGPNSVPKW